MNANSLQDKIAAAKYVVTSQQVESIATAVQTGREMSTTYLRAFCTALQAAGSTKGRKRLQSQLELVEKVNSEFMPAVKRGVSFRQELDSQELHARCGFARVTASAFRQYVKRGGDLKQLDTQILTRRMLVPEADAAVSSGAATTPEAIVLKATARILRCCKKLSKRKQYEAVQLLDAAIKQLQDMRQAIIPEPAADATAVLRATLETPAQRTRAGKISWKQATGGAA